MTPGRTLKSLLLTGLVLSGMSSLNAHAQESDPFYEHDAAKTIFGPEAEVVKAGGPEGNLPIEERLRAQEIKKANAEGTPNPDTEKTPKPEDLEKLSPEERLKAEYGAPDDKDQVKAQSSAPKPFKALMECVSNKMDDELCYQYARRYVRYVKDVKSSTDKLVGYQGVAMEREGMVASSKGWPGAAELRPLLRKDLEESQSVEVENLDPSVKKLIDRVEANDGGKAVVTEATIRQQARASVTGKITPSAKGTLVIYGFFDMRGQDSVAVGRLLSRMEQAEEDEPRVSVRLRSLASATPEALRAFQEALGTATLISDGRADASALKVTTAPTVVFVQPETRKLVRLTGTREFAYYDEL